MSKNNISFILNKPQLSENIGACARAIKNFNFKKLVLINPKPIFPNDKILATSVGAKDIIKQSKNYDTLEKAISKITARWAMIPLTRAISTNVIQIRSRESKYGKLIFSALKIFALNLLKKLTREVSDQ